MNTYSPIRLEAEKMNATGRGKNAARRAAFAMGGYTFRRTRVGAFQAAKRSRRPVAHSVRRAVRVARRASPRPREAIASDILVLGSPVYFHYPVAAARAFTERLLFAPLDYTNPSVPRLKKNILCACLYTMHMSSDKLFDEYAYKQTLGMAAKSFEFIGSSEALYFRGLTIFEPHERYEIAPEFAQMFDDMKSKNYADYERECLELGRRLVGKAKGAANR